MYRLLLFFYIFGIIFSLKSLISDEDTWYRSEVSFSDWRNIGCVDYSTNKVVTDWYSNREKHCKYFRPQNANEIVSRLRRRDTIIIGLDYYILTKMSDDLYFQLFKKVKYKLDAINFIISNKKYFEDQGVRRLKVWYDGKLNVELLNN